MDGVIVATGTIFKAAIMMAWKTIEIKECPTASPSYSYYRFFFLSTKSWNTSCSLVPLKGIDR